MSSDSVSGSRTGSVSDLIRRFEGRASNRVMSRCLPPKGKENRSLPHSQTPTREPLTMRSDGNATIRSDGNATSRSDGNATVRSDGNSTPSDHQWSHTSSEMAVKDSLDHVESFLTATSSIWHCDSHDPFLEAPFDERRATRFFGNNDDYYEERESRNEISLGRPSDDERTQESFASAKTSTEDDPATEKDSNDMQSIQRFPSDEVVPGLYESYPSDETSLTSSTQRAPLYTKRDSLTSDDNVPDKRNEGSKEEQEEPSGDAAEGKTEALQEEIISTLKNVGVTSTELTEAFEVNISTRYIGGEVGSNAENDATENGSSDHERVGSKQEEQVDPCRFTSLNVVGESAVIPTQCPDSFNSKFEIHEDDRSPIAPDRSETKDVHVDRDVSLLQSADVCQLQAGEDTIIARHSKSTDSNESDCGTLGTEITPPTFFPLYKINSSMESLDLDGEIESFFTKKAGLVSQTDSKAIPIQPAPSSLSGDASSASFYPLSKENLTIPSIGEDHNIEVFFAKQAPPEGASARFIQELNKFIAVASPFFKEDGRLSTIKEEELRHAASEAGIPLKLVDRLLWQINRIESVNLSYSGDFDLDVTPPREKSISRKDENEKKEIDIFSFFELLEDLVKREQCGNQTEKIENGTQHDDDKILEAVPDQILLQNSSESAFVQSEVDDLLSPPAGASANYVKSLKKFKTEIEPFLHNFSKTPDAAETIQIWEAAQLAGVSPKTVNRLLDILERRQRSVPHQVSTLSSSVPDDESQDMDGEEDNALLEWIENLININVCEKRNLERVVSITNQNNDGFEFTQCDERLTIPNASSGSTIPSVGEDSRIEKFLAKFTPPEGASSSEIDQLNQFLMLTISICADDPTAVQQAQIRQAAGRIGFPLELIDHFIDQAIHSPSITLPSSSAGTENSSLAFFRNFSEMHDSVASEELKDLLKRLASPRRKDEVMLLSSDETDGPSCSEETNEPTTMATQLHALLTCVNADSDDTDHFDTVPSVSSTTKSTLSSGTDSSSFRHEDTLRADKQRPCVSSEAANKHFEQCSVSDQLSPLSGSISHAIESDACCESPLMDSENGKSRASGWTRTVAQHPNEHEILKLVGEVAILSTGSESSSESSNQDSVIENFLTKFTPPQGASEAEIDQLNQFLKLTAPICSANPTPVQQAQIRQAAIRMQLPLKVVDDFLEEATEKWKPNMAFGHSSSSDESGASASTSGEDLAVKHTVDSDAIVDLLHRLRLKSMDTNASLSRSGSIDSRECLARDASQQPNKPHDASSACLVFLSSQTPSLEQTSHQRGDKPAEFIDETTGSHGNKLESENDAWQNSDSDEAVGTTLLDVGLCTLLHPEKPVDAGPNAGTPCVECLLENEANPNVDALASPSTSIKSDKETDDEEFPAFRLTPAGGFHRDVIQIKPNQELIDALLLFTPSDASLESVNDLLRKFVQAAEKALVGPDLNLAKEKKIREAANRKGWPELFVDQFLNEYLGDVSDRYDHQAPPPSTVSTWGAYKRLAYTMEEENQDEAIAAFLQRFATLTQGGHFPKATLDTSISDYKDCAPRDDAIEIDITYGFANKSLSPVGASENFQPFWLTSNQHASQDRNYRVVSFGDRVSGNHFKFDSFRKEIESSSDEDCTTYEDTGIEVDLYGFVDSQFEIDSDALSSRQDWKRTSLRVTVWDAQPGSSEDRGMRTTNRYIPHGVHQEQRHFTFHHVSSSPPQKMDWLSCTTTAAPFTQQQGRTIVKSDLAPTHLNLSGAQGTDKHRGKNPVVDVITTFTRYIVDPIADDPLFHHVAVSLEQFTTVQKSCTASQSCFETRVDQQVYEHMRVSCRSEYRDDAPTILDRGECRDEDKDDSAQQCETTQSQNHNNNNRYRKDPPTPFGLDEIVNARSPPTTFDRQNRSTPVVVTAAAGGNVMNFTTEAWYFRASSKSSIRETPAVVAATTQDNAVEIVVDDEEEDEIIASRSESWPFDEIMLSRSPDDDDDDDDDDGDRANENNNGAVPESIGGQLLNSEYVTTMDSVSSSSHSSALG